MNTAPNNYQGILDILELYGLSVMSTGPNETNVGDQPVYVVILTRIGWPALTSQGWSKRGAMQNMLRTVNLRLWKQCE